MKKAVIALGSNIGDTLANLKEAVALLEENGCNVLAVSRLYQTEPWGYADQDDFLNGAILIETDRDPFSLLELTQGIEKGMGRKKLFVNGPRNIDLDILLYEEETVESENLTIPHPRISVRMFVLRPMMDIVPGWTVPGLGTVAELYEAYDGNERVELSPLELR
ncbi:MAG: 2-amino-4-hydroxy-6-hydroxymethyldihydropteridine diphosphokinase [Clostridia bacterium]